MSVRFCIDTAEGVEAAPATRGAVTGGGSPAALEWSIGPWTASPASWSVGMTGGGDGLASFAPDARESVASPADGESPLCWRMEVDGSPLEAEAALEAGRQQLALQEVVGAAALSAWPEALDRAVGARGDGEGEAVLAAPATATDDSGRAGGIGGDAEPPAQTPGDGASAAIGDAADESTDAARSVEEALRRLARLVFHHAWVETWVDGVLRARTVMGLSGNTRAVLAADITPALLRLHARQVRLAVRSRDLWARIFMTAARLIARISAAGLNPVMLAAAIPALWRLLRALWTDLSQLRALSSE